MTLPAEEPGAARHDSYKWIALSNTTIGVLMATINQSIVLIALPDIFNGIHLNPLTPSNSPYFLWMLMGFMVVTAVLDLAGSRVAVGDSIEVLYRPTRPAFWMLSLWPSVGQ